VPFRDAYRQVAAEVAAGGFVRPDPAGALGATVGAPEKLELGACRIELDALIGEWRERAARVAAVETAVFDLPSR
jgi:hypothetical protein